jgi:ribosome biogenesis GTPase / thiamine phosphate phosphatase
LLGSSGAGKSSLINALLGEERQQVNRVRVDDSKGRHTTTTREMIVLPSGGVIIDTPGIREVGMTGTSEAIDEVFEDILAFASKCKFTDCRHEAEPGCAVLAAVESGDLLQERLDSYHRLSLESVNARRRSSAHLQRAHEKATTALYKNTLRIAKKDK